MRIDRLVLHGFKSFADRTEVVLLPGVTAVVGPNGSGKSNLVEAVRFVVGARAARLRARGADELVFQGSPTRRPAGFAEVRLALAAPVPLEIQRRVYRDGQQEVRLNGARASLRQVAQALAGSGLGPSGAAIIGQGQVAAVLEAPPDRLLAALVEAAGLAGVEVQAREAAARLAEAEARLAERTARVEELEARKAALDREVENVQRARALTRERLGVHRYLLAQALAQAEADIAAARKREAQALAELKRLTAEEERLEAERAALIQRIRERQGFPSLAPLRAEKKRLAEQIRSLAREVRLLEEQVARIEKELANLPPLPVPPGKPARSEEELAEAEAALKARVRAEEKRLSEARKRWARYLEASARYQAALAAHRSAQAERERLEAERERLGALVEQKSQLLAEREAEARKLVGRRTGLVEGRNRLRAELRAIAREREREERALHRAAGPREILAAGLPGVLGSVAGLLVFPPDLKRAAEAALGARLDWVLVEDEAALRQAVRWLKTRGLSATLLARDLAQPPVERPVPRHPGIEGRLREWVKIPGEDRLTRTVVGETLLARDLDAALGAFRERPSRIVTRDGERLEPTGAVSTGRTLRGTLDARARILELAAAEERVQSQLDRVERALKALHHPPDLAPLREELAALVAELRGVEAALRRLPKGPEPSPPEPVPEPSEDALRALRAERERLLAEREALLAWNRYQDLKRRHQQAPALREELASRRAERDRRQRAMDHARDLVAALEGTLARLETAARLRDEVQRELATTLERLEAEIAGIRRRREAARSAIESAKIERTRREVAWEAARKELAQLPPGPEIPGDRARIKAIEAELAALGPLNYRAEAERNELEVRLERERAELEEARAAWRRIEELLTGVRREFDRRLREARETLARRFAHYATELLGGTGTVEVTAGGLRLALAPEGKRVRALRLLSTGEKTMGALALLFALAEVREGGLPIVILDEVDAALDEANLARFARFLERFKTGRQILLVTHQKRTLEAADAVLGVTSQGGVSRVYGLARRPVGE